MPIPALCSDQPAAICCTKIFTLTQDLVILAGNAVNDCFGEACEDIPFYVSHGEPVGGGDYVAAWLAAITTPPAITGKTFFLSPRFNINVLICLSGFPEIKIQGGDFAPVPSADEHTHAAYFSYGAMEAMYRAVGSQLLATGTLGGCTVAGFSQLIPHTPAAGSARWSMTVYIDDAG